MRRFDMQNTTAMTPAERQRRSRAHRAEAGGALVQIALTPAATAKVKALLERDGGNITDTINRVLQRQRVPVART
jgi:hypothetical protein